MNKLEVLAPADYPPPLVEKQEHGDGILLYSVLELFKRVKDAVFSLELADNHEEVLADFKTHLHMDYTHSSLPITPKLHIIFVHVVQWVRRTGTGLAKMNFKK